MARKNNKSLCHKPPCNSAEDAISLLFSARGWLTCFLPIGMDDVLRNSRAIIEDVTAANLISAADYIGAVIDWCEKQKSASKKRSSRKSSK